MGLSPQDAAAALDDIKRAERRSATLHGYQEAAPHLIVWGLLWALGYGLTDLQPHYASYIWWAVVPLGVAADFVLLRFSRHGAPVNGWRFAAAAAILFAFVCAALFVLAPVNGRQFGAFPPLVVAAVYTMAGLWLGWRFFVAGIAVAVLTLTGFYLLPGHFPLWMAVVGGGALILAGLWLRRV